jgi:rhodanese-related sulfurtransferase
MKFASIRDIFKRPSSKGRVAGLISIMLLLLPIGTPYAEAMDDTQLRTLADAINRDQDFIRSSDLADWIIQDRKDYMLIDVRSEAEYMESHIDGAVSIPLLKLLTAEQLATLSAHKTIVLYSNASMRASQAATALRLSGLNAYPLIGGYEHWVIHTLNPESTPEASPYKPDEARRAAMASALKNCEMSPVPHAMPATGYTPPLAPVTESLPPPPASGGGVLLDEGC